MPNHVHGIIGLMPDNDGPADGDGRKRTGRAMADIVPGRGFLGIIVNHYKGAVTRWSRRNGHGAFAWQPRFHDRIIRDAAERDRIRLFIERSPAHWDRDQLRPG